MASGRSRRSCSSSRAGSSIGSSVRLQRPPCRAYWTRKPDTAHRRMRTMSVSVQIRRSPGPAEAVGIRGYPSALEQVVTLRNGASVRLGPIRLEEILRAGEQRGIRRFSADVLTENRRALRLLARYTDITQRTASDGVTSIVFRRRADSSVEATRQGGS